MNDESTTRNAITYASWRITLAIAAKYPQYPSHTRTLTFYLAMIYMLL